MTAAAAQKGRGRFTEGYVAQLRWEKWARIERQHGSRWTGRPAVPTIG
jgi:hypothetical protein